MTSKWRHQIRFDLDDPAKAESMRHGRPNVALGALAQILARHLAYREASTLAFADAFRAIMLAFVLATLLAPLLRNIAAAPAQSDTGQ